MKKIIIDISDLQNLNIGESKDYPIDIKIASADPEIYFIKSPVKGRLKLTKFKNSILGFFNLKTKIILICSRCAEKFSKFISLNYHQEFKEKRKKNIPKTNDVLYLIENDKLNVLPSILQEINLSIPIKPLCKKNCSGICQFCGQNLNQKKCSCQKETKKSPFAILKDKIK